MDSPIKKKYPGKSGKVIRITIPSSKPIKWFTTGGNPAMQPIRAGNEVSFLIDGSQSFRRMVAAIRTATGDQHYIYLLGWLLVDDFQLIRGDATSTVQNLFTTASNAQVQIRVMLWDQLGRANSNEVNRINSLANGAAILDNRTLNIGAHHQKILIIKGTEGLISFCGGVDINNDRVDTTTTQAGSPMHDVHARIIGPASFDLLNLFLQRWTDHPNHTALDSNRGTLRGLNEAVPSPVSSSNHFVQIGRTYGNIRTNGYAFAPHGEQTAWRLIQKGIQEARKFIYIEDQYLVSMTASRELQAALPNIEHLTILIPQGSISDLPQVHFRRNAFIAPLRAAGGQKVRVFFLSPAGAPHTYVHAKTWIFDDEYAVIGSANCNRRGYTHDSEVVAGIYDTSPASNFAHNLRIELWAEHLNMSSPQDKSKLADGITSADFWLNPPSGAHVAPYIETNNIERIHRDFAWNQAEDPDGS